MKDIITKFAANNINTNIGNNVKPQTFDDVTSLDNTVISILNVIIGLLGFLAVGVIIIGGINYMTSSGDASKVKKAKDTILYGIIGLIVCVLAFAIVNFVINNILSSS